MNPLKIANDLAGIAHSKSKKPSPEAAPSGKKMNPKQVAAAKEKEKAKGMGAKQMKDKLAALDE